MTPEPPSSDPVYGFMMFEGRYVSTVWSIPGTGEDWLAFLWLDRDNQWRVTHRFKVYGKDNQVFDSDDEVSWTDLAFPAQAKTEAEAIRITDKAASQVLELESYKGAPIHKILVRTASVEEYDKIMRREKFMHFGEEKTNDT